MKIVGQNAIDTEFKQSLGVVRSVCRAEIADDTVFVATVDHFLVIRMPADKLNLVKSMLYRGFYHGGVASARSLTVACVR